MGRAGVVEGQLLVGCDKDLGDAVATTVHNPDRFMADLRTVAAQGRKRIGFLIGAGAGAGLPAISGTGPLIPAVAGLTKQILDGLAPTHGKVLGALQASMTNPNIETILSKVRALSGVIGSEKVHGLDGPAYADLSQKICGAIGTIVNVALPNGPNAYRDLVNWIVGTSRTSAVEIFTTNYDRLFEEAFESARAPFFDGFSGSFHPFFDPVTVASCDLPSRWTCLWKLHGSLGWRASPAGEVVRTGDVSSTHLIFPEHLKYDQTQKAPYAALFDRLRSFLMTPDTLLLAVGFSFADAHVSARIDDCLAANPSASVFAFQFRKLADEPYVSALASKRPNLSVYASDKAIISGIEAEWRPGDPPSKDWEPIRSTFWATRGGPNKEFTLGDFSSFCRFLVSAKTGQVAEPSVAAASPAAAAAL